MGQASIHILLDQGSFRPRHPNGCVEGRSIAPLVGSWVLMATMIWGLPGCKSVDKGPAPTGAVGAMCVVPEDCALVEFDPDSEDGPVCLKMPHGYCSIPCDGDVWDCDDESICDQLGDQAYYCLDGCLTVNHNGDCRPEYRCSLRTDVINLDGGEVGVCLPRCKTDFDCEAGRRCLLETGDCLPRGERSTGETCEINDACNGGLCLRGLAFREGYCSGRCGSQFVECEEGSLCTTLGGEAICLLTCEVDSQCRAEAGYICRQVGERRDQEGDLQALGVCVPRCQGNGECDDGHHCDLSSGTCVEGAGAPNPDGEFCDGDADCQSGRCLVGEAYPNGYCTRACETDDGCGEGVCREARCLTRCGAPLDCRGGYVCSAGACIPHCKINQDCSGDTVCSLSLGTCVLPSREETWLEDVLVTDGIFVGGEPSESLSVNIPSDALSFAIMAEGNGPDLMVIAEMTDPWGRLLYDFHNGFGSEVRFYPGTNHITQFVPSSPRTAPQEGTYRFRFIKEGEDARISVRSLVKRGMGEPTEGTLDLNLFFATMNGLNAASAPEDSVLQLALSTLREVFGQRGVRIGEVHYCDLPSEDRDRFAVIDSVKGPSSELGRMFTLSARAEALGCTSERAINFFMVQEIVGGRAGFIILGISGGIPGPSSVHGTTHSGVAVTMAGYQFDPRQLGLTMAHEGAHYLGLFHTTEAEGQAFDPLPDTPECGADRDRDSDGVVTYKECESVDAENLMFWSAGEKASQVTSDQGFILLRNPAIK